MASNKITVRMAPSPTGFFHVGSARTALYNWLFARHHGGSFILRVEDTDIERSSKDMIQVILDGLSWLGLNWDGEPYFQSQRSDLYKKHVDQLVDKKLAYFCYCDPQELEQEKKETYKKKQDWKYNQRCLHLSQEERAKKEKAGIPRAVRFLVPDKTITYKDIVFGEISREAQDIEDFVIMRANGMPTYNLACIIDDHAMEISHVIRGADHITNTPKQILLYEAFKFATPEFAHLPLLLGPDRSKLSKRHGAVSLDEYREKGFLPGAMINYLALVGWSPGDDREDFMNRKKPENLGTADMDTLAEKFTLKRVNQANAVFDTTKLAWMNQQYISQLDPKIFREKLKPFAIEANLITDEEIQQREKENQWFTMVCDLMHPRLKVFSDITIQGRYFFKDDFKYDISALQKFTNKETLEIMGKFLAVIKNINPFDGINIEKKFRGFSDDNGWKVKQWIHPLRVFTTGSTAGPPLFDTLELIGKERVVHRIEQLLNKYGSPHATKK